MQHTHSLWCICVFLYIHNTHNLHISIFFFFLSNSSCFFTFHIFSPFSLFLHIIFLIFIHFLSEHHINHTYTWNVLQQSGMLCGGFLGWGGVPGLSSRTDNHLGSHAPQCQPSTVL
ncbi:hypothetical protein AB205_0200860 [Aquarana catesbeiana]|uniref:Uncharacterized protein n=1 Tax=Aquarana catesbeiana TaxID=8400 RepID=A0A2G9Q7U2_AQUCT|nr:hypothetical protein AB205_0200860 [Aquarana catesbeiana]